MFDSNEWEILLDLVSDGILIADHESNIVKVNKAYERMANRTAQELIGTNINEMAWRKDNESSAVKVLQSRKPVTTIQQVIDNDEKKEYLSTGMPMFNEHNEIVYVVSCIRDLTELHDLRRTLEQIKQMNQSFPCCTHIFSDRGAIPSRGASLTRHDERSVFSSWSLQQYSFSS